MSLRSFHLIFIALSILMCAVMTAWGLHDYLHHGNGSGLGIGVFCAFAAIALSVYGFKVFAKFREMES